MQRLPNFAILAENAVLSSMIFGMVLSLRGFSQTGKINFGIRQGNRATMMIRADRVHREEVGNRGLAAIQKTAH